MCRCVQAYIAECYILILALVGSRAERLPCMPRDVPRQPKEDGGQQRSAGRSEDCLQ